MQYFGRKASTTSNTTASTYYDYHNLLSDGVFDVMNDDCDDYAGGIFHVEDVQHQSTI